MSVPIIVGMIAYIAAAILLISFVVTEIKHRRKSKEQMRYFEELYRKCIDIHGLAFAQKIYNGCRNPLWIGMDNVIAVFEHHCGIENELSKKIRER